MSVKPILHYDFEHLTPDGLIEDMSGNGYHGTIVGATLTENQWGNPNAAVTLSTTGYFKSPITEGIKSVMMLVKASVPLTGGAYLIDARPSVENSFIYASTNCGAGIKSMFINGEEVAKTRVLLEDYAWCVVYVDFISSATDVHFLCRYSDNTATLCDISEIKCYGGYLSPTQVKKISSDMMRKIGRQ